jgi:signal transduction histidine kinase
MSFADREPFSDLERRLRFNRTKAALLLGALMMPGGAMLDWLTYPSQFGELFVIRFAVSIVLVLGYLVVQRLPANSSIGPISMGLLLAPAFAMAWMIYITDGAASLYYLGLILLMVFIQLLGFTFAEAATFCGCCILAYALAVFQNDTVIEAKGKLATFGLFFLGTTGTVSVVICELNRRARESDFLLRRELAVANDQLKTIIQQRGEFLANVSHELRTPLSMVLAPLDEVLAFRGSVSESVGQSLAIVRRNADRLRLLVDDLLDVVRIETAQFRLQREECDGRDLIIEIVRSAQGLAKAREVQLSCVATSQRVDLNIDVARIERVMFNLITNAIKFSPVGGAVEIRLDVSEKEAVFRCRDSGPGIPDEFRERVFERHFQIYAGTPRMSAGLGLGLAIAKEIVEAHAGKIACQSLEGTNSSGCEFVVTLPLAEFATNSSSTVTGVNALRSLTTSSSFASFESSGVEPSPQHAISLSYPVTPHLELDASDNNGCDVLVIDDEHDVRQFLQTSLTKNYRTLAAETAEAGVETAKLVKPRCILLDMMLPDHDGLWVLRQLRASLELQDTKILMLTAQSDESVKLLALKSGIDDFLSKPFGVAELDARVAGLIRASQLQTQLRKETHDLELALRQLKATEAQLFQSEKIRAIGNLAAGLLHEMNNPINYTLMAVTMLKRDFSNGKAIDETIDDIEQGVTRIGDIIGDLRSFAYPDQSHITAPVRLREMIETAIRFALNELRSVTPVLSVPDEIFVDVSKSQVTQLLLNLLTNAAKATMLTTDGRSPRIAINATVQAGRVAVTVQDNGVGMSAEVLARITEPFFTTSEPGQGMGLGLSISETIARTHGSRLTFDSKPQIGTLVTFDLPISRSADSR